MRCLHLSLALSVAAALSGGAALAEEWKLHNGDRVLTPSELSALADGGSLTFHDDGVSRFSAGGAYSYTYGNGGGTAFGNFEVMEDGRVCIRFSNGFDRCDLYVRNGLRLILLTQKGERFPVKVEMGLRP